MHKLGLASRTRADVARHWPVVIGWQLVVQMIGLAVVLPLSGWFLRDVVGRSGSQVVSSFDLESFLFTPEGAAFVVAATIGSVAFHLAQFAGYTWIAGHAIRDRPVTLWGTAGAVWARIGLLAGIGRLMLARVALLALPFLAAAALLVLITLRGQDVGDLLSAQPPEWRRAVVVFEALAASWFLVVLWHFARWIHTMPLAMFDRERAPHAVLDASERALSGKLLRTIAPLVAWWLLLTLVTYVAWRAGRLGAGALLAAQGMDVARMLPILTALLALTVTGGLIYATVWFAGHQFLITRTWFEHEGSSLRLPEVVDAEARAIARRQGKAVVVALGGVLVLACGVAGVLYGRVEPREHAVVAARVTADSPARAIESLDAAAATGASFVQLELQRDADGRVTVDGGLSLEDAIARARGHVQLDLRFTADADGSLVAEVVERVRATSSAGEILVSSPERATLRRLAQAAPELRTGRVAAADTFDFVPTGGASFVALPAHLATADAVRRAHHANLAVHAGPVRDVDLALRLVERGVDVVITPEPAPLVALLRARDGLSTSDRFALGLRSLYAPDATDER